MGPGKRYECALVWFRRDLRSHDHAALHYALKNARQVHCVFVFDSEILDKLADRADRRVEFIWHSVEELALALQRLGGGLQVLVGRARELIPALAEELGAQAVCANHDYEPATKERDAGIDASLHRRGRVLHTFKDQVIFEKDELLTQAGRPYTVFTPYKKAWLAKLAPSFCKAYAIDEHRDAFAPATGLTLPTLEQIGFKPTNLTRMRLPTGMSGARRMLQDFIERIDGYRDQRDFPGVHGVSCLSVHLRFGTISIRELVRMTASMDNTGARTWLSELIWREFYFGILHHYPHVVDRAFRAQYGALEFRNSQAHFSAWCEARTGFPLVDAGMRQLNETGYMHNRVRMVAASFLVKDLHVDWRWGEAYFARKLNDFDLAANNGGWQWSASTGCDAQPWFRIFNPITQSKKFDPDGRYIRMYLPELANVESKFIHEPWEMSPAQQRIAGVEIGKQYPAPITDHATARAITLEIYQAATR